MSIINIQRGKLPSRCPANFPLPEDGAQGLHRVAGQLLRPGQEAEHSGPQHWVQVHLHSRLHRHRGDQQEGGALQERPLLETGPV